MWGRAYHLQTASVSFIALAVSAARQSMKPPPASCDFMHFLGNMQHRFPSNPKPCHLGSDGRVLVPSSLKKARFFQDFPESRMGLVSSQAHCGRRLKFDASLDGWWRPVQLEKLKNWILGKISEVNIVPENSVFQLFSFPGTWWGTELKNWKTEKLNSGEDIWGQHSTCEFSFSVFQFCAFHWSIFGLRKICAKICRIYCK